MMSAETGHQRRLLPHHYHLRSKTAFLSSLWQSCHLSCEEGNGSSLCPYSKRNLNPNMLKTNKHITTIRKVSSPLPISPESTGTQEIYATFILWLQIISRHDTSFLWSFVIRDRRHTEHPAHIPQSIWQPVPITFRPQPNFLSCPFPFFLDAWLQSTKLSTDMLLDSSNPD